MAYFNQLNVDLNDKKYFPDDICEHTLENPNLAVSTDCKPNQDSLNIYSEQLADEILISLTSDSGEII